ncbi:hypothetical protein CC2G_011308 [Coprinopsis cinerea AmutBmut pab1-1]|nr:hypothetical protein CC2G_011308 [Coprinopsis cinerea AmutBmut pab1-1]
MLPIELLLKIVDHLADDPKPTKHLTNLSLTSRTFTAACQSHLFKELNLEGSRMEVPFKLKFLQDVVLDGNPSILNYVQSLRISFTWPLRMPFSDSEETHMRASPWLLNDPTFKRVLESLGSLPSPPKSLALSHVGGDVAQSSILSWIRHSFFPSSITKLELTNCDDAPMHIFLLLPHLKELVLNCTSTDFDIRKEQHRKELDSVVEEGTLGGTLIGPPLKEG